MTEKLKPDELDLIRQIANDEVGYDSESYLTRFCEPVKRLIGEHAELAKRVASVCELLAANGCDCDCGHHHEEHHSDCERCLACRINEVVTRA